MANEKRVRQAFLGGLVDTADLAAGAAVFNSGGLAALLTTIDATNHLPIILDPDGLMGPPEIAYITACTAGATTGTIAKGKEGTTDRQHLKGTPWVHGPTLQDIYGDSAWSLPTYVNSWVDSGSGAGTRFRKGPGDRVELQIGSTAPASAVNVLAFTLPVGYRPGQTIDVPLLIYSSSAFSVGILNISTTGTVQFMNLGAAAVPANAQVITIVTFLGEN